jgi:sugar O-acyltransferase (sialic acid O-acetyltransferase NeuD family)
MADIVVFGAGEIAQVAHRYIDADSSHRIVGFTVDAAYRTAESFGGLPLVAWEELESRFPPEQVQLLGPLSYRSLNELRRDRYLDAKRRGYAFASFVHPASHVYADEIGENAFILEANVIQPGVRIGRCAMIWSGNHIGHHAVIEDYCFLASQVGIGSNVRIGERTFVGGCVAVHPGVTVGAGCLLALGANVRKDVPDESTVRGPAHGHTVRLGNARLKRLL